MRSTEVVLFNVVMFLALAFSSLLALPIHREEKDPFSSKAENSNWPQSMPSVLQVNLSKRSIQEERYLRPVSADDIGVQNKSVKLADGPAGKKAKLKTSSSVKISKKELSQTTYDPRKTKIKTPWPTLKAVAKMLNPRSWMKSSSSSARNRQREMDKGKGPSTSLSP